jgi:hypothetical protein
VAGVCPAANAVLAAAINMKNALLRFNKRDAYMIASLQRLQ